MTATLCTGTALHVVMSPLDPERERGGREREGGRDREGGRER